MGGARTSWPRGIATRVFARRRAPVTGRRFEAVANTCQLPRRGSCPRAGMGVNNGERISGNEQVAEPGLAPNCSGDCISLSSTSSNQVANCILDEAHHMGTGTRGALLDNLISRLRKLKPDVRLLLLSPFISNIAEVAAWLGEGSVHHRSSWRPTRQLRGLARLYGAYRPRPRGGYAASGGVALMRSAEDFARRIVLPDIFEARFNNNRIIKSNSTDHAIEIARHFVRAPGSVLAFFSMRASAERCARRVAEALDADDITVERQALVDAVVRTVGSSHELVAMVSRGVAYHHGRLPRPLRSAIENGLRNADLKFVAATSTLAEGVNTPVTTVIISGTSRFDEESQRQKPMDVRDFLNMTGRAGRPLRDTEGQVILVPQYLGSRGLSDARRFFFPPESELELRSAFEAVEKALLAYETQQVPLPREYQTLLFALVAAGLTSEEDLSRFLDGTFSSVRSRLDRRKVALGARRFIAERAGTWPDLDDYRVVASTGLSADGVEVLYTNVLSLFENAPSVLTNTELGGPETAEIWLRPIIQALRSIPDLHTPLLNPGSQFPHEAVLARWLNYWGYPQLAGLPQFEGEVEKAVAYIGQHADLIAWGIGSMYLVARHFGERHDVHVSERLGAVPLLIRFGVNSLAAGLLGLIGLTDRTAARILGEAFVQQFGEGDVRIQSITRWVGRLDEDRVVSMFPDDLRGHVWDVLTAFGLGRERRARQRARISVSTTNGTRAGFPEGSLVMVFWRGPGRRAILTNVVTGRRIRLGGQNTGIMAELTRRFDMALLGTVLRVEDGGIQVEVHGQVDAEQL